MSGDETHKEKHVTEDEITRLMQSLPKATSRGPRKQVIKYQNFWFTVDNSIFRNVVEFQNTFVAQDPRWQLGQFQVSQVIVQKVMFWFDEFFSSHFVSFPEQVSFRSGQIRVRSMLGHILVRGSFSGRVTCLPKTDPVTHFAAPAQDTDIFISGMPKTGTTWLKSLLFATVNRENHPIDQSPLLTHHPQELVYNIENDVYNKAFPFPHPQDLDELPSPRLLSTHVPYTTLPESIKTSGCRILYICRNPKDVLVSAYYFLLGMQKKKIGGTKGGEDFIEEYSLKDIFEDFCDGKSVFSNYYEHVLEYWKASMEQPNKVFFLRYEEMKDNPTFHLKRLAEFIGKPFSTQEENEGVVQQIVDFCNIKNMKELDGNKNGTINKVCDKESYFRKGEVGDWVNHFTPSMVERINKLEENKLQGTGLSLKVLL